MSTETRRGSRTYVYLAARDPLTGKVTKRYLGNGDAARAAVADLAARRVQRDAELRALRDAQARTRDADARTEALTRAATTLLDAALLLDGWHRPNSGPWRKKRHGD